jgi:hypothetical protein
VHKQVKLKIERHKARFIKIKRPAAFHVKMAQQRMFRTAGGLKELEYLHVSQRHLRPDHHLYPECHLPY